MDILFTILICVVFLVYIVLSMCEIKHLVELLAAKDYADYKNFKTEAPKSSEHKNMFTRREDKLSRMYDEQE